MEKNNNNDRKRIFGIYGPSGTGKSTSLVNLDPEETYWIAPTKAPYSRKGTYTEGHNFLALNKSNSAYWNQLGGIVEQIAKKGNFKNIIIEDFTHVLGNFTAKTASMNGYGKWNDLAVSLLNLINSSFTGNLIFIGHAEINTDALTGSTLIDFQVLGKLMKEKFYIPSYMDSVLFAKSVEVDGVTTRVLCSSQAGTVAKSKHPIVPNMFPNDFNFYLKRYEAYDKLTDQGATNEEIIETLSKITPEPVWEANALTNEVYFEV